MFRIPPALDVGAYKTYSITSPHDRTVVSSCEQVGCAAWQRGWQSTIDESTDCAGATGFVCAWLKAGATPCGTCQARYIRYGSRRTFREQRTGTGLTVFMFEPGQRCFENHQTRPELYVVRDGDWRGNPTGRKRVHANAADWTEDFGEHQQRVADQVERG